MNTASTSMNTMTNTMAVNVLAVPVLVLNTIVVDVVLIKRDQSGI